MTAPDLTGAVWRKSSRSNGQGQCVEVAHLDHVVAVRDSKDPSGGLLTFTLDEWAAFLAAVKVGEFNR